MTRTPVLALSDFTQPFIMEIDASNAIRGGHNSYLGGHSGVHATYLRLKRHFY